MDTLFTGDASKYKSKAEIKMVDSDPVASQTVYKQKFEQMRSLANQLTRKDRTNETKV